MRLLTGLRASNLINLRWWDKDGKDGAFQSENGSYQEMLVPGGVPSHGGRVRVLGIKKL